MNNIKYFDIKIKNIKDLKIPTLGDELSSGYDIVSISDPEIVGEEILPGVYKNIQYIQYHTGVYLNLTQTEEVIDTSIDFNDYPSVLEVEKAPEDKINIQTHLQCFVYPRSSITKYNLMLINSIPDISLERELIIKFKYLFSPEDVVFLDPKTHPSFGFRVNLDKIYLKNDLICQIVFSEISPRINFQK